MGAVEAVTSIINSLAWPAGLVVLGWIFRQPVGRLIDRAKSITGPGGLHADLEMAAELAVAGAPPQAIEAADAAPPSGRKLSPEARVFAAWESFNEVAFEAAKNLPVPQSRGLGPRKRYGSLTYLLRGLQQEGLLRSETATAIQELRSLRNQVANGAQVSETESREYERTARVLGSSLDFAIKVSLVRAEARASERGDDAPRGTAPTDG
jgi:hypothetical protein